MTTRETAYAHKVERSFEPEGEVTVEVYVLWPAGGSRQAADLLFRVAEDVLAEVEASSPEQAKEARKVSPERTPTE